MFVIRVFGKGSYQNLRKSRVYKEGMHVHVCVQVCTLAWRGQRLTTSVLRHYLLCYFLFLRQCLRMAWSLPGGRGWLVMEPKRSACLCLPGSEITNLYHYAQLFHTGIGGRAQTLVLAQQAPYRLSHLPALRGDLESED